MYELFISSSILMLILRSLLSPPPPVGSGICGGAGGPCGGFPWSAICIRSKYYFSRRGVFLAGARTWFLCLNLGWNLSGQRTGDRIASATWSLAIWGVSVFGPQTNRLPACDSSAVCRRAL